jgi:hypothetical protein
MGEVGIRCLWLSAAVLIVACGSKQLAGGTTANAAEAERLDEPDTVAVSESTPVALKPEDDLEEEEPEEPEEPSEELDRDVRMMSYEDAMALPVEIGDASVDGGEAQLTGKEIARFMDERLDEMYDECIEKELRRGNELRTVTIDLAIRGKDGMVLGTTIEPGRHRFRKCLEDYLEDVRFPTFASARMGARYRFHTD